MAVGKQSETTIVHWHPGESTGHDGLGTVGAAIPGSEDAPTASGVRAFEDARVDAQVTRLNTLSARLVASGVITAGV